MNEIKIYLKTSGRIAELYKDFDLYEGCYRNSQMSVYVPKSLLYENEDGTFANLVKTGAILTAPNGKKLTTKSYYLDYVKTETVVGIAYAVYTIITPKEFCVYAGTQTVVVNVESIDNTDKDNQKVISVTTTQTANLIVLESAYLGQDEPIEPTELDKIKATLTEIEGEIDENTQNISELTSDVDNLSIQVSDLSEDKLDKVSGNTTYKQAYAKDTNGDQIMQNYSTENVTNAIVQRDETGNIKITPGREGYMNDGATMRNIADVESEVAKKYDKTGGTIDGNVTVTGDLTVQGTTITENAETLDVKANVITTNSEGVPLINLSGLGIRTDATNVYGIMYDPQNDSVKLGLGSLDEDNNFTFNQGEGLPIAVRDDSTAFTDKHVIVWDAAGDKFVDGGGTLDEKLDKVTGTNTVPRAYTVTETGEQSMTDLNSGIAPYTIVYRNSAGYFDVLDPAQYTNPVSLRYYNQNVPIAVKNSYATQTALANTQRQVDGLYTLLEQKNEIYVQTATDTYTTRETAGGENIADGVQTPVKKITGKTVKTTNLFSGENITTGNCTYENGIVKQVKKDDSEYLVWKVQLFKDTTLITQATVEFVHTGTIPALTVEKTSDVNRLSLGLNGKSFDTMVSIDISDFPNGTYTITWNVLNITQGSISWDNIMLNEGSTAKPYMPYFPGLKNAFFKEIVSTGRNLIPYPYYDTTKTVNGVTFTLNDDYSVTVNGTSTSDATAEFYFVVNRQKCFFSKGTYTINSNFNGENSFVSLFVQRYHEDLSFDKTLTSVKSGSMTFENDTVGLLFVRLYVEARATVNNVTMKPMLNYGSSALPYEPYTQSVLSLPEAVELTEYDTAYPETGEIQRQSNTITFNGTETWQIYTPNEGNKQEGYTCFETILSPKSVSPENGQNSVTNNYMWSEYGYASTNSGACQSTNYLGTNIIIKQNQFNTIGEWKAHLAALSEAGNPLTVTYKTAEATTEQADFSADSYIAWKNGSETIEQGDTDNSEYGAENTVEQDYYLLTAPQEVTKE